MTRAATSGSGSKVTRSSPSMTELPSGGSAGRTCSTPSLPRGGSHGSTMPATWERRLYKAYLAIRFGRSFEQDGEF